MVVKRIRIAHGVALRKDVPPIPNCEKIDAYYDDDDPECATKSNMDMNWHR